MIQLPTEDLHRLRQMRDDLQWLSSVLEKKEYENLPYRHYLIQMRSTLQVVGSLIRNTEEQ